MVKTMKDKSKKDKKNLKVYGIRESGGNIFYIGATDKSLKKTLKEHRQIEDIDDLEIEPLFENLNPKYADLIERALIAYLK